MKTILITLDFHGAVHAIRHQVTEEEWSDPQFRAALKDRFERNPTVLRMIESEEPDWKSIAKAAQAEAKGFAKQVADLTKKLKDARIDEKPFFGVFYPQKG